MVVYEVKSRVRVILTQMKGIPRREVRNFSNRLRQRQWLTSQSILRCTGRLMQLIRKEKKYAGARDVLETQKG